MQLLKQYELSCILTGSLHIYYQFIVCAFTKYGAVRIEQQEIRQVWKQIWKQECLSEYF